MSLDWSQFVFVTDPGIGQPITTLHPCFAITFYLQRPDYGAIGQFFDASMQLIKPGLTHYQAEVMKRPAPLSEQALTMIPTWLRKPKALHRYWWSAHGGADLGVSPPGFELSMMALPKLTPAQQQQALKNALTTQGAGEQQGCSLTSVAHLLLPVDHELTEGAKLLAWLSELAIVRTGAFMFGDAGYCLASLASAFGGESEQRERSFCSRHPGLDCFRLSDATHMLRADPDYPDFVPLVKRAAWTTLLHPLTVAFLGGESQLRERLAAQPAVVIKSLPFGLAIQAGARPQLGDLNRGELLPLQREVARVLRPARINRPAEKGEFWAHFFNVLDKEYS